MAFNFEKPPERPSQERELESLQSELRHLEAEQAELLHKGDPESLEKAKALDLRIQDLKRRIRNKEKDLERSESVDEGITRNIEQRNFEGERRIHRDK